MIKHYTFETGDGRHQGFYEITSTPDSIVQETRFKMEDFEIHNLHRLKLSDGSVTAFKLNDQDWVDATDFEEGIYPSCAWPLFLDKVNPEFTYVSIDEGDNSIMGQMKLVRTPNKITEYDGDKLTRAFIFDDDELVQIDWGGAISNLRDSHRTAIKGSPYEENY